jgi:septal ring factor EnvC (AmiA/AmiB activator)
MAEAEIERYRRLAALTARVARATAELEAAREEHASLQAAQAAELDELADRLQALHVLLANEVERAWNAAEADARRARRAEMMGRVHDAVSAETTLPEAGRGDVWQTLGPYGPEGPATEGLAPPGEPPEH